MIEARLPEQDDGTFRLLVEHRVGSKACEGSHSRVRNWTFLGDSTASKKVNRRNRG